MQRKHVMQATYFIFIMSQKAALSEKKSTKHNIILMPKSVLEREKKEEVFRPTGFEALGKKMYNKLQ